MKRAVFLDRDGTVIVDKRYLDNAAGVELLPGAGEGLAAMAQAGYVLVLVTNQSGVGRGYFAEHVVVEQYARLQTLLKAYGVAFDHLDYCPHAPDEDCVCRKPRPGMLMRSAKALDIDLELSFMIGDKAADILAGQAAGCATIRIGSPADPKDGEADGLAGNLLEAAAFIARLDAARPSP